jgi:hypothetical protein
MFSEWNRVGGKDDDIEGRFEQGILHQIFRFLRS